MGYADQDRQREYQRNWVRKRREDFFLGKTCVRCGSAEQLELDHIDPATKISHYIWSWSSVRREAELLKCQVLCRTCHQVKSDEYQTVINPCGTVTGYTKRKCRCPWCRAAWAANARAWRASRKVT